MTIELEDGSSILELPYSGNGYLHEIDEVNKCISRGDIESTRMPLKTSHDLIEILDRIKNEIGLTYSV